MTDPTTEALRERAALRAKQNAGDWRRRSEVIETNHCGAGQWFGIAQDVRHYAADFAQEHAEQVSAALRSEVDAAQKRARECVEEARIARRNDHEYIRHLEERAKKAEAEVERWRADAERRSVEQIKLANEVERVSGIASALEDYVSHRPLCATVTHALGCDCGLYALLRAPAPATTSEVSTDAELVAPAQAPIIEMRLCETTRLGMRPNVLYQFTVDPACEKCRVASAPYEAPAPAQAGQEELTMDLYASGLIVGKRAAYADAARMAREEADKLFKYAGLTHGVDALRSHASELDRLASPQAGDGQGPETDATGSTRSAECGTRRIADPPPAPSSARAALYEKALTHLDGGEEWTPHAVADFASAHAAELERENAELRKSLLGWECEAKFAKIGLEQARSEVRRLCCERDGEVWLWQGDGSDDLDSIACPVLIEPEHLRSLRAERDRAWEEGKRAVLVRLNGIAKERARDCNPYDPESSQRADDASNALEGAADELRALSRAPAPAQAGQEDKRASILSWLEAYDWNFEDACASMLWLSPAKAVEFEIVTKRAAYADAARRARERSTQSRHRAPLCVHQHEEDRAEGASDELAQFAIELEACAASPQAGDGQEQRQGGSRRAPPPLAGERASAETEGAGSTPAPGDHSARAALVEKAAKFWAARHPRQNPRGGFAQEDAVQMADFASAHAAELERENAELKAGIKGDTALFVEIMVEAIRGCADAAIVKDAKYDGRHALAWVKKALASLRADRDRAWELLHLALPKVQDAGASGQYEHVLVEDIQAALRRSGEEHEPKEQHERTTTAGDVRQGDPSPREGGREGAGVPRLHYEGGRTQDHPLARAGEGEPRQAAQATDAEAAELAADLNEAWIDGHTDVVEQGRIQPLLQRAIRMLGRLRARCSDIASAASSLPAEGASTPREDAEDLERAAEILTSKMHRSQYDNTVETLRHCSVELRSAPQAAPGTRKEDVDGR